MKRYHVYRRPRPQPQSAGTTIINLLLAAFVLTITWLAWPFLWTQFQIRIGAIQAPTMQPTDTHSAIGNQAPPDVRSTNGYPFVGATPLPNIAQNDATAQAEYQAAIDRQNGAPADATPLPAALPLNSAGQPIIDSRQQQQLDMSATMAAREAQGPLRAAQLQAAASRPPDVSADQVATMTGRNPCSVPRSDPATCDKGLYKPTPVNP